MNKLFIFVMTLSMSGLMAHPGHDAAPIEEPTAYTIDKILAVIYSSDEAALVTLSDLRPGLDGVPRQLHQVILDRLMMLDAQKLKVNISEADIDRNLARVQELHNLDRHGIINAFKEMGFTLQEGREELRRMQMIDGALDHRVRSKIFVEKKEVEEYYKNNPIPLPATYTLAEGFVPFSKRQATIEQRKSVQEAIDSGSIEHTVNWQDPITLESSDIAESLSFITNFSKGQATILEETDSGIKVLRLVDKQGGGVVPLKEREREIQAKLAEEKFNKKIAEYQDGLWKTAKIYYIDPADDPNKSTAPAA